MQTIIPVTPPGGRGFSLRRFSPLAAAALAIPVAVAALTFLTATAHAQQDIRPRYGVGFHGGVMNGVEAMSLKGVDFSLGLGPYFSLVVTFEHQDYIFETDCGYHRNEAYVFGSAVRMYPLGYSRRAILRPYATVALSLSHILLGGTDWTVSPTEDLEFSTNALVWGVGAGIEVELFAPPGGDLAVVFYLEAAGTWPLIAPAEPKCACDCIEVPDGKSTALRAGLLFHF